MKALFTVIVAATLSLGMASVHADEMKKEGAMMKHDGMAKDGMKKDAMAKDGMAKDGMKKDAMAKDGMKHDGMAKDGMKKDGMSKGRILSLTDQPLSPLVPLSDESLFAASNHPVLYATNAPMIGLIETLVMSITQHIDNFAECVAQQTKTALPYFYVPGQDK